MVQDPLSAIGARLEARLNLQSARFKSIEETVRARIEANPPAEFTLLPDGTKQFGYAPVYAEAVHQDTVPVEDTAPEESIGYTFTAAAQDEVKAQFMTLAPSSHWDANGLSNAEPAALPADFSAPVPAQIAQTGALPVLMVPAAPVDPTPVWATSTASDAAPSAPAAAPVAASPAATNGATTAPAIANPAHAVSTAANVSTTATNAAAAASANAANLNTSAANASGNAGFVMLADGTKQFGFAPTGPVVNLVRNLTPPVPSNFGPGATFRIHGLPNSTPMTVTRGGDGVVFAMYTDSEGTREMAFMPNQLDLVTASPT